MGMFNIDLCIFDIISFDYYQSISMLCILSNLRFFNIAAFLANAMDEGIRIDSCDEWNMDSVQNDGKLPLSNLCGQFGR